MIRIFEQDFEAMLRQYENSIDDKKQFTALVKDLFPQEAKNVNLILIAYNMGIAQDIQKANLLNNTFAFRYVKQLMDDYGISRVNADWIVSVWCVAYGSKVLGKECDISFQKQGEGPAIVGEKPSAGKQYGELFSYKQSSQGNGLAVTGFHGDKNQTIIFQNRSNNTQVIEISDNSFASTQIEEAIITEGIQFIGNGAFAGCSRLHQAVLPISIKEIGDKAFEDCKSLKSVSLPSQLEKIGNGAFKGTGLRTVSIPKSVYWIGDGIFSECSQMESEVIPENLDRVKRKMFQNCMSLRKVSLHEKLEAIEDRAFLGCRNLDFIVIPDSVHDIGQDAFTGTDDMFIVQCSFGSFAEQYCRKNKIKYQLV